MEADRGPLHLDDPRGCGGIEGPAAATGMARPGAVMIFLTIKSDKVILPSIVLSYGSDIFSEVPGAA